MSVDLKEIENIIEAVLFASGDPVSAKKLCDMLEISRNDLDMAAKELSDYYDYNRRGLRIVKLEDSYQLCSRVEYADFVRKTMESRKPPLLSSAALEVLAIVAYRQPVTRAYIEQVRGVDSSNTVVTLQNKGLLEECGRLDVPGRPMLYRTSLEFLRCFGLTSLDELPDLPDALKEESRQLKFEES